MSLVATSKDLWTECGSFPLLAPVSMSLLRYFGLFHLFFLRVDRITALLSFLQEHPVVITKFIRGAREVEVDAVAKAGRVRLY